MTATDRARDVPVKLALAFGIVVAGGEIGWLITRAAALSTRSAT